MEDCGIFFLDKRGTFDYIDSKDGARCETTVVLTKRKDHNTVANWCLLLTKRNGICDLFPKYSDNRMPLNIRKNLQEALERCRNDF